LQELRTWQSQHILSADKEGIDSLDKKLTAAMKAYRANAARLSSTLIDAAQLARPAGDFADASAEQTAGLDQVHQAISAMDQATQQNAALVEQTAAAAAAMREETCKLSAVIHAYTGGEAADNAPAPERAAAPSPSANTAPPVRLPAARKAPPRRPGAAAGGVKNGSNDVEWAEF